MFTAFPFKINNQHHTATVDQQRYIRQLIEQVLFTQPGERVNRPEFGSNVMSFVFAPMNDELAVAQQFLIQSALQQWLGDLIQVEAVSIEHDQERANITIQYVVLQTQQRYSEQLSHIFQA